MLYKNFIHVTIHHSWKAGKLYYDVKKEMELKNFFFISNQSPMKKKKVEIYTSYIALLS